jgi:hypothetical protein
MDDEHELGTYDPNVIYELMGSPVMQIDRSNTSNWACFIFCLETYVKSSSGMMSTGPHF